MVTADLESRLQCVKTSATGRFLAYHSINIRQVTISFDQRRPFEDNRRSTVNREALHTIVVWLCLPSRCTAENHPIWNCRIWSLQRKNVEVVGEHHQEVDRPVLSSCYMLQTTDVDRQPLPLRRLSKYPNNVEASWDVG